MRNPEQRMTREKVLSMYTKYKEFVRFVVVGFINTGVDFLGFTIVYSILGLNTMWSQTVGYSFGVINSFLMNKWWTFENRSSTAETTNQFTKFVVINGGSLLVSLVGIRILHDSFGLNVYVAKVLVTILAQMVNFAGYKLWVFVPRSTKA